MIYDCFIFFNELELLEFRLKYLDKFVDYFVIVESTKTFTGKKKELFYLENKKSFKKYQKKILHVIVKNFPGFKSPWSYESYQRNVIFNLLKSECRSEDIILISDADEIPNLKRIPKNIEDGVIYGFLQDFYFYYLNTYKKNHLIWEGGTRMLTYRTVKENLLDERFVKYGFTFPKKINSGITATKVRLYRKISFIKNGGWHFSYLGGVDRIIKKIKSFSHQELIKSGKFTKDYVSNNLNQNIDIFDSKIPILGRDDMEINQFFKKKSCLFLRNPKKENFLFIFIKKEIEILFIKFRNFIRILYVIILK